ncbi:MAG TPA: arginine deiminase family protein [Thermomicrobiales bacterium]|nr:arginine deiminase family protein [Thermomicrobiales bacterium]
MALETGRVVDVVKQTDEAPHGGEGWRERETSLPEELGTLWAACGVASEYATLNSVLMRTPGPEIETVTDPRAALWYDVLDPARARAQHAGLVEFYRSHGVTVHLGQAVPLDKPNAYFCRDHFCMTPQGAIIARMASQSRAGEERYAAADLADLGVPIVHSVFGEATFEGADVVVANEDLVFVGNGMRSNRAGAEQVAAAFRRVGVPEVIVVEIPYGCGHIDGTINVIDRDLALVFPTQLSWTVYETMRRHGFRFVDLPSGEEAQMGMAINMVPLAPRVVVLPMGNPITVQTLEANGCEVFEVEVSELMKGGGAVHCMTGVIHRA